MMASVAINNNKKTNVLNNKAFYNGCHRVQK